MTRAELEEKLRQLGLLEHQLRDAIPLINSYLKEEVERAGKTTADEIRNVIANEKKQWLGDQPVIDALSFVDEAIVAYYGLLTPPVQQEKK